jgi:putative glycosyltransferase (TIGR04372 family)
MSVIGLKKFIKRQIYQIKQGGRKVLVRKIKRLFGMTFKSLIYIFAIPTVLIMRLIRPWLLVRICDMWSSRIGHFAANTELYLCERDAGINVPNQRHIDVFYMALKPICNQQLAIMWQRLLRIWPAWILAPIDRVNRLIPGGKSHEIGYNAQNDRDVHNLLDRFPPHLQFTTEEETRGESGLQAMGIPIGAQFVCLSVRDSAYLAAQLSNGNPDPFNYHNYRDSNTKNYVLAAETLAERGYYVIRMGAIVHAAINSAHPKVIDYASNGMRTDFMDIYLGAKCAFCISVGTGFDAVPIIFRRPVAFVNVVPAGNLGTFSDQLLTIIKHHVDADSKRELSLSEIIAYNVAFSSFTLDFEAKGIDLLENTPEEIRDVAIEMVERVEGTWQPHSDDETFQERFWEIFPVDAINESNGRPHHGEIRGRFGSNFLRNNPEWLK